MLQLPKPARVAPVTSARLLITAGIAGNGHIQQLMAFVGLVLGAHFGGLLRYSCTSARLKQAEYAQKHCLDRVRSVFRAIAGRSP